jgi:ssDNA thymidine ADP-ribosyltransferase DarT-like protein
VTAADPLQRIARLFHFTDRRNLPVIRQYGGLLSMAELVKRGIKIPAPGGNDWSHDADGMFGMDRYVHLCFRSTHPMEYLARQDGRIVESIFLEIDPLVLQREGVMFTADVSNKSGIIPCPILDAKDLIDYEVLYTRTDWSNPDIQQRLKQAEKFEILIPKRVPVELIRNMPNG